MLFSFESLGGTGVLVGGHNAVDADGNPAGGAAASIGLSIDWQDGPVDRDAGESPNGAFVEDVLEVCAKRLEFYQQSRFACGENARALRHVHEALESLLSRRRDREDRGVQGKHEA